MILLLVLGFVCGAGSLYLVAGGGLVSRRELRVSLARAAGRSDAVDVDGDEPEGPRRFAAAAGGASRIALAIRRGKSRDAVALELVRAGLGARVTVEEFLALKVVLAAGGALGGIALGVSAHKPTTAVLLGLILAALGFLGPDVFLRYRLGQRREAIRASLPSTLDLLAVSVEAGLGLDAAISRITDTTVGPLADELSLVLGQMSVGESRAEAMRKLAERVDVPELTSFVRALLQADKLGLSVARTLRIQASEVRSRRQAAVEEQAAKAPVKMLFPTVFFIFPALFVVVLGPPLLLLARGM